MQFVTETSPQQKVFIVNKEHIKDQVRNWEKNRPEDSTRVDAIRRFNDKYNVSFVDGIVYAWNNGDNVLRIYDGWTRYSAANDSTQMLLSVYETPYEGDIILHFIALNSAVPVPSLYIEDTTAKKKKTITTAVNHFCDKHKSFLSASRRPHSPNFNRDNFTDDLNELYSDDLSSDDLIAILEKTNIMIARKGSNFPQKAISGELYLFADKKTPWKEQFKQVVKEHNEASSSTSWLQKVKMIF